MNANDSLDRESFQRLLASAFAVQESQIDPPVLSGIMEVQRLITKRELGLDAVMPLVVDSARDVANAAGVTVGLFEGNQLVYRAGSGSSAANIGSHVKASLTLPPNTKSSREILRVEDAETDTRIEAAICRQFGAKSLLILPIYHHRALAGILEVLFSQAHIFRDREVRTYRLMAGLIESAMEQAAQVEQEHLKADLVLPHAVEEITPHGGEFLKACRAMASSWTQAIYHRCRSALAVLKEPSALRQPVAMAKAWLHRAQEINGNTRRRAIALAAGAAAFGLVFWAAHSRGPALPLGTSPLSGSSAVPGSSAPHGSSALSGSSGDIDHSERLESTKPDEGALRGLAGAPPQPALARTRVRRARVGQNEVEYIGDDVTVRHFAYKPATLHGGVKASQVAHFGDDVTVRYFTPTSNKEHFR
jgi:GAF domain-containing protein